jgi:hypothetical protein
VKKFLTLLTIFVFSLSQSAYAVQKKITVQSLALISSIGNRDEISGMLTNGKTIILYGSNVKAVDISGTELWNLGLEEKAGAFVTTAVTDNLGNIWAAGSLSSGVSVSPSPSPSISPLNPDSVVLTTPDPLRSDLNSVGVWKISNKGEILTRFHLDLNKPVLATDIAIDESGVSISGITDTGQGTIGVLINCDNAGICSKPFFIGSSDTNLDGVVRNIDGSKILSGGSSETLFGKKVVGSRDGILITVSKMGKISKVVRSSAAKSKRNWKSITNNFLLGGEVTSGNKSESAITKFSGTLVPTWNVRFPSTGNTLVSNGTPTNFFTFFASTSAISNLSGWNPKRASGLVLRLDNKGTIMGGYSASPITEPLAMAYSKELGLVVAGLTGDTVSIFHLISR